MSGLTVEHGSPVARLETPVRVWRVSPVIAGWLRLHLPADHHEEMLQFMLGDPVSWRRVSILARHMGGSEAPLIGSMVVEAWGLETVHAAADFADGTCWASSRLILRDELPDTVMAAMAGRRLGDVVDNPYLPPDAVIERAGPDGANGGRTAIHLAI